jgi:hypothetical protein
VRVRSERVVTRVVNGVVNPNYLTISEGMLNSEEVWLAALRAPSRDILVVMMCWLLKREWQR